MFLELPQLPGTRFLVWFSRPWRLLANCLVGTRYPVSGPFYCADSSQRCAWNTTRYRRLGLGPDRTECYPLLDGCKPVARDRRDDTEGGPSGVHSENKIDEMRRKGLVI